MQYNYFHIKNFKGIDGPLNVNLTEGNKSLPYVLVGNNGAGKTTILTAIETIYQAITSEKLELKKLNEIMPKQVYFTDSIVLGTTVFFEQADIEYVQQQMEENKSSKRRRELLTKLLERLETDKTIKITYVYSFASNRLESQEILIDESSNSEFLDLVINILRNRLPHIIYRNNIIDYTIEIANRYTNNIIFLLDAPASNLHIHPQEKILEALIKLSAGPNVSIIYSTHSPYLIDANSCVGNIFIVTNDAGDDGNANIRCADITNIDPSNNAVRYALEPVIDSLLLTSIKLNTKDLVGKIINSTNKLEKLSAICGILDFARSIS